MIYEDYDGHRAEQTVNDDETLKELEAMLTRAKKNPAELDNCTMNCTLFCTTKDGEIFDFAVATDGCPYITDRGTDKTYRLTDADAPACGRSSTWCRRPWAMTPRWCWSW